MMSEKIKMIMVKRDVSGADLADTLGCSRQNVWRLLKEDNWNEEQLKKIADRLN